MNYFQVTISLWLTLLLIPSILCSTSCSQFDHNCLHCTNFTSSCFYCSSTQQCLSLIDSSTCPSKDQYLISDMCTDPLLVECISHGDDCSSCTSDWNCLFIDTGYFSVIDTTQGSFVKNISNQCWKSIPLIGWIDHFQIPYQKGPTSQYYLIPEKTYYMQCSMREIYYWIVSTLTILVTLCLLCLLLTLFLLCCCYWFCCCRCCQSRNSISKISNNTSSLHSKKKPYYDYYTQIN